MTELLIASGCSGGACEWNFNLATSKIGCSPGGGGCADAKMAAAATSSYHPPSLAQAAADIDAILKPFRDKPEPGYELAFINVKDGVLLAWVEHPESVPAVGITIQNSLEEITNALQLQPTKAS